MSDPQTLPAADVAGLLQHSTLLWRGGEMAQPKTWATGFPTLDARLPGGGWPVGTLIEIAPACEGIGELSLAVPLLRNVCGEGRPITLVSPPHIPYAPAWVRAGLRLRSLVWVDVPGHEDAHWCAQQVLRGGHAGAVLLWSRTEDERTLRRLQLAAETGGAFAFLFRPPATLRRPSPAAVRVAVSPTAEGTRLEFIKVRGGQGFQVTLPLTPACS